MQAEQELMATQALSKPQEIASWLGSLSLEQQSMHAQHALEHALQEASLPEQAISNPVSKLSSFMTICSKSKSASLRRWASSEAVVTQLFESYIEWDESDQRRSAKALLDLVIQLLKDNQDKIESETTMKAILGDLISVIRGTSTKPIIKAAIKACENFLAKGVMSVRSFGDTYMNSMPHDSTLVEQDMWSKVFAELLQWTRVHTVCPIAGKFVVSLYRALRGTRSEHFFLEVGIFKQWLLALLSQDPTMLEPMRNYIFGPLFKGDRQEAMSFLHSLEMSNLQNEDDTDLHLPQLFQLAAFEAGKRVGLVEEPGLEKPSENTSETSTVVLPESILTSVLSHPSLEVRALAFSLLITSPSTTRPYSTIALGLLRRYIGTYVADTDAKFRVDVMARSREMFKRIRGSICVLKRSISRAKAKSQKQDKDQVKQPTMRHTTLLVLSESHLESAMEDHVQFLRWYILFLRDELVPTASYQRHVGSLKALSNVLRMEEDPSKPWETPEDQELFFDLFDASWARALYDLVMDPFEDVREMSAAALRIMSSNSRFRFFVMDATISPTEELRKLEDRCDAQAKRTARADDSDGAARAAQVVFKSQGSTAERLAILTRLLEDLKERLAVAESDLGRAVLDAPLHGKLAALRLVWQIVSESKLGVEELESLQKIQDGIVECCERVWAAVRGVLCIDSPEGHLPQEMEEMEGLTTRDVLSYSFRSTHESSNLMRAIALTLRHSGRAATISPSMSNFKTIGTLTFEQLSTLRHRGAFSTVTQTFATCCQQAKYLHNEGEGEGGRSLLNIWYKGTLDAIYAQASTTRRSAGIPALMTGILSANAASPSFDEAMQKLIEIAGVEAYVRETDGSNLPQVHAFNCLKDIFKNSVLTSMGNKSEAYITQCLQLAATGLKSEVWAIRNCSLILLRSLIDSLFGSNETKNMIEAGWDGKANRIAYYRYPTLPDLLVNLLESGQQMMGPTAIGTAGAESVFPALDIIRRAGPPDTHRDKLQGHIVKYLSSPVWHVREMAARTLCSCLLHDRWLGDLKLILGEAMEDRARSSQNYIHGALLTLQFVFERLCEVSPDQVLGSLSELQTFLSELRIVETWTHCKDLGAAYLAVCNRVLAFGLEHSVSIWYSPPLPNLRECGALHKVQAAVCAVYQAQESETPVQFMRDFLLGDYVGDEALSAALEIIPTVFKVPSVSHSVCADLSRLYIHSCLQKRSPEVQSVALRNLSEIMDHYITDLDKKPQLVGCVELEELWTTLVWNPANPTLSDAVLRISGSIVAMRTLYGRRSAGPDAEESHASVRAWGLMVADAVLDDKPFDTRFAAVETLQSFFSISLNGSLGVSFESEEYLPALAALYDALNDDDDEVRDAAAAATKHVIGQAAVPLEAANRLLGFLATAFKSSAQFREAVVARLVGSRQRWTPAAEQIDAALKVDDSLFAVEEQNLFIDEIREVRRWISVLEALELNASDPSLLQLDSWLQGGLDRLRLLFVQEDGPLGWASTPQAFAVASAVILCSVSLVGSRRASPQLEEKLRQAKDTLHANADKHISGLLVQPLKDLHIAKG